MRSDGGGDDIGDIGCAGALGVLAGATADGDVAESPAVSPVATAGLAEVTGLREIVVIVVAELGVERVAPRALERLVVVLVVLVVVRSNPPVPSSSACAAAE